MKPNIDNATLNQWYVIDSGEDLRANQPRSTRLLGTPILGTRHPDGTIIVVELGDGGTPVRELPIIERYGYVFTTLGEPGPLFDMPEFDEPGRRLVICGAVSVRTSPGRIVENFLDMSHFPFVHTGVLGAEPLTEVMPYKVEVKADSGELWATECGFNQPQAMASSSEGADVDYLYRVPQPFTAVLYKTCPENTAVFDLIGIFPQPLEPTLCDVHTYMLVYDEHNSHEAMLQWQQGIFLQDRIILENQRPACLPLEPRSEIPNQADIASVQYRRWLKSQGVKFGTA